jgi:hypothetical protein
VAVVTAQAQLYLSWKKAQLEREELLCAARHRRYSALTDLRIRHENHIIVLENERRAALGAVVDAVESVRVRCWCHDVAAVG